MIRTPPSATPLPLSDLYPLKGNMMTKNATADIPKKTDAPTKTTPRLGAKQKPVEMEPLLKTLGRAAEKAAPIVEKEEAGTEPTQVAQVTHAETILSKPAFVRTPPAAKEKPAAKANPNVLSFDDVLAASGPARTADPLLDDFRQYMR